MTTNDPKRPTVSLTVYGTVERFASVKPERLVLKGFVGQEIRQSVTIRPEKKYPFKIIDIKTRGRKNIAVNLIEPDKKNNAYILSVENKRTTKGRYQETVALKTDNPLNPFIKIPVYGAIRERTTK